MAPLIPALLQHSKSSSLLKPWDRKLNESIYLRVIMCNINADKGFRHWAYHQTSSSFRFFSGSSPSIKTEKTMSGKYSSSPEWADLQPIPLDEGGPDNEDGSDGEDGPLPLATIAYPPSYLEATSYLRAVMAANEMSERVLKLTEDVISMNPAHYTVWSVSCACLFSSTFVSEFNDCGSIWTSCPTNIFCLNNIGFIGRRFCLPSKKTYMKSYYGWTRYLWSI